MPMSFQTTYDQNRASRPVKYPNAEDPNFLGYDREHDLWKVGISGAINIGAVNVDLDQSTDSVRIYSASGTPGIPVYLDSSQVIPVAIKSGQIGVDVSVDLDQTSDSVRIFSASGYPSIPVYIESGQLDVNTIGPLSRKEAFQDLSIGPLNYTTDFNAKVRMKHILFNSYPVSPGISEHFVASLISKTGPGYDTIFASGFMQEEHSIAFFPDGDFILEQGDEINVYVSNATTPPVTGYVTVLGESLA